jgi:Mn2+/Fe2+ NRAMP family transporter
MGQQVTRRGSTLIGAFAAVVVSALNLFLLVRTVMG